MRKSARIEQNVALATKSKNKKKIKCYHCGHLGHYATKCPMKKIMRTEKDVAASAVAEDYPAKFEQEFSLVLIDSNVESSTFEHVWFVDSGAIRHITGVYYSFQMITLLGPGHFIQTDVDSPQIVIQGVGIIRFQLDLGEILEIHGILFVPGMRVSKLSVSSFADDGYGMMIRSGHIFLYRRDEPIGTILLGDRKNKLYDLRGHVV